MNKYFSNPELKRSSMIIVILAFITLMASFFTIKISYEKMKINYTESNMAIAGQIIKNHPELSSEIIPLITKGTDKSHIEEGKRILNEYGFNENLKIEFIPAMENSYNMALKGILISLVCFFVIVFWGNYIQYMIIYKRLEKLILGAQNIVEYNFDIGIYENAEGTFAKLAHSFNNMRVIMKNNFSAVEKEKKFLVDTLSDISHQLKTPISSLIIYNDILLERNLDEEKRKEFLENSKNQLNRIEWLVKSLLRLAKLDAGVIKFEKIGYDINKTVADAVEVLKAKAEQEKIDLDFQNKSSQIIMEHDPNWLREGIVNIIKNSLEHTERGGKVEVSTERTPVCIRIIVKDNGEGIPKEEIPHIFKRFYKGKKSKNSESVGIGLALSKSIVEGHGGIIEVRSKVKEGTTFTITFLASN
ncbi:Alkaline phosphatase synthesis sensor protein PhoR [Clostridium liquoris]|jgi:hypothetical protein|uniref:histidine kinase n=1 Tax=Clostridium liquoris TaxID=1289519 RepID=A0A2T0B296_9CLOT|nr:HAMP domain-containing sensor histidine kinase [Clostridium liquoris]PRR77986.1 Alkaline phosphatase synthesis sensor protein PhoR [Clostridium liquoris]